MLNNNKIYKFMHGRYAKIDELSRFLLIIYAIILTISMFCSQIIFPIISLLIFLYLTYRYLSKNTYKRIKENNYYLKIKNKLTDKKYKDRNHIYKKCHHCHTKLKLPIPNKKGIKHVICPKCKKNNKFLILKQLKIEIIKNNK